MLLPLKQSQFKKRKNERSNDLHRPLWREFLDRETQDAESRLWRCFIRTSFLSDGLEALASSGNDKSSRFKIDMTWINLMSRFSSLHLRTRLSLAGWPPCWVQGKVRSHGETTWTWTSRKLGEKKASCFVICSSCGRFLFHGRYINEMKRKLCRFFFFSAERWCTPLYPWLFASLQTSWLAYGVSTNVKRLMFSVRTFFLVRSQSNFLWQVSKFCGNYVLSLFSFEYLVYPPWPYSESRRVGSFCFQADQNVLGLSRGSSRGVRGHAPPGKFWKNGAKSCNFMHSGSKSRVIVRSQKVHRN